MTPIFRTVSFVSLISVGIACITIHPAAAQGTTAQRQACMSDAMSLCASDIPNASRIEACLRRERERVSPACLGEMGVPTRSVSLRP